MKQSKKQILKKNLLSLAVVAAFAILAIASSGVNKLHWGAFHYNRSDESDTENSTFIVKNDGTRIFGEKIKLQGGFFSRSRISIDDQTFPINEVKAYKEKNIYYGRLKKILYQKNYSWKNKRLRRFYRKYYRQFRKIWKFALLYQN